MTRTDAAANSDADDDEGRSTGVSSLEQFEVVVVAPGDVLGAGPARRRLRSLVSSLYPAKNPPRAGRLG